MDQSRKLDERYRRQTIQVTAIDKILENSNLEELVSVVILYTKKGMNKKRKQGKEIKHLWCQMDVYINLLKMKITIAYSAIFKIKKEK